MKTKKEAPKKKYSLKEMMNLAVKTKPASKKKNKEDEYYTKGEKGSGVPT